MSTGAKPIELEHKQRAQSSTKSRAWLRSVQSGLRQEPSPEQVPEEERAGRCLVHVAADPRLLVRQVKWFVKHYNFLSLQLPPFYSPIFQAE